MTERILVTGLSGFIAKHIALALLKDGYAVRGTVRTAAKGERARATLQALAPAGAEIETVEADLGSDSGWDAALAGCAGVMHVASPFPISQPRDKYALVPEAREGTLRVLRAALAAQVPRIVLTSSVVAMAYRAGRPGEFTFGEKDWTDPAWPVATPYTVSKTEAERAAWAFMDEAGARQALTTVNPGLVLGPVLDSDYGTSLVLIERLLKGQIPALPRAHFVTVDVRDVALIHLRALNRPETGGRRLLAAKESADLPKLAALMRDLRPEITRKVPSRRLPDALVRILGRFDREMASVAQDLGVRLRADSQYVSELTGVPFTPLREAVGASLDSLSVHGNGIKA